MEEKERRRRKRERVKTIDGSECFGGTKSRKVESNNG